MARRAPRVVAFSGRSGSGKTTLLVKLIPALRSRGLTVAAFKHSGHPHSFDQPGKDSARLREAGAVAVVLEGASELAYFGPPLRDVRALLRLVPPCDLVLAEGFRQADLPRVMVDRGRGRPRVPASWRRELLAVVSAVEPSLEVPWFLPSEVEALADHLVGSLSARRPPRERARPGSGRAPRGVSRERSGEGKGRSPSRAR
jgi:molybdopterin-guanine dinucleotide biosynthesis adapter protein